MKVVPAVTIPSVNANSRKRMLIGMHALTITVHKSDVAYMRVMVIPFANLIAMMNFESDKWNVLARFKDTFII